MPQSTKEQMKDLIERQPDDSSYEEILRELAFHRMVERGVEDAEQERTIPNEEMKRRIDTWSN